MILKNFLLLKLPVFILYSEIPSDKNLKYPLSDKLS